MSSLESIAKELGDLGYAPKTVASGSGFVGCGAVVFDYTVDNGRYKGQPFRIGIGFQEESYPEYPPHFIYIAGLSNPKKPVYSSFSYDNSDWLGFSAPPSDFWDNLPSWDKNMKTYLYQHLTRFWSQI